MNKSKTRVWVIKIGSSLLTDDGRGLNRSAIAGWATQVASLREQGIQCVIVSSGSVAEGLVRLGWQTRPRELHELQAAAAVGQMGLVEAWETALREHGVGTAQVLLTHEDLASRKRYLNARNTLRTLLSLGIAPVINENDTVASEELRLGDNDTLAGMVTNLLEAERLVILTDQAGLFEADPREQPDAKRIDKASADDPALLAMAGGSAGHLGRGGMRTKVLAAQRAACSGANTVIASGREADILLRIAAGEGVGTVLEAEKRPLAARKRWIASQLQVQGVLHLDAGAVRVLCESGRSLLPVGVTAVEGNFECGDVVSCVGPEGAEVARGLARYPVDDARQIAGKASDAIEGLLGYTDGEELIHRDDMVLL